MNPILELQQQWLQTRIMTPTEIQHFHQVVMCYDFSHMPGTFERRRLAEVGQRYQNATTAQEYQQMYDELHAIIEQSELSGAGILATHIRMCTLVKWKIQQLEQ